MALQVCPERVNTSFGTTLVFFLNLHQKILIFILHYSEIFFKLFLNFFKFSLSFSKTLLTFLLNLHKIFLPFFPPNISQMVEKFKIFFRDV